MPYAPQDTEKGGLVKTAWSVADGDEWSPKRKARTVGGLYLMIIACGVFAEVIVRGRLIVTGDAAATAHNIVAHEQLYRLGFGAQVLYVLCNVPIMLLLYDVFGVVSRGTAGLMLLFGVIGKAIEGVALVAHYAPLVMLGNAPYLAAYSTAQLQSAAYLSLRLFEVGFAIALPFYGFFCVSLGSLVVRSTFFPRAIGWLLVLQGSLYLVESFAGYLSSAAAARVAPLLLVVELAAGVSFCLWLLVVGVNVPRWRQQAMPVLAP